MRGPPSTNVARIRTSSANVGSRSSTRPSPPPLCSPLRCCSSSSSSSRPRFLLPPLDFRCSERMTTSKCKVMSETAFHAAPPNDLGGRSVEEDVEDALREGKEDDKRPLSTTTPQRWSGCCCCSCDECDSADSGCCCCRRLSIARSAS